jgi:hypothetical protein
MEYVMNRPPIAQLQAVRGVGQFLRNTEGPKAPEIIWLVAPARERKSARPNKTRSPTTKSWECFILSTATRPSTLNGLHVCALASHPPSELTEN